MKKFDAINMAFKIFIKSGKGTSVMICFLYLAISLVPSILLIINKLIFEEFSAASFSVITVCMLLGFYVLMQLISKILSYLQSLLQSQSGYKIQIMLQKIINKKMLKMYYFEFDNPNTKDIISRVSSSVPEKSSGLVFGILDAISILVQIILAIAILINIHWLIPLTLVAFSVPYIFLYKKMCFDNYFLKVNQGKEHRKNWYLIQMLFDKNFNKELKVYDCFDYLGKKEEDVNIKLHKESYSVAKKYALLTVLLDIVKGFGKGISILISIYLILFMNASIAAFTVLIESMDSMQGGLLNLFSKIGDFNSTLLVFNDYMKFSNIGIEDSEEKLSTHIDKTPFITINNLSFDYPTKANILNNISLTINCGDKIAIVGENGSGKTTLVNLLLGLYKPTRGKIEISGNDLNKCFLDFRKKVVYVMQNMPQYRISIDENLRFNNVLIDRKILEILDIDKISDKAPKGNNTQLGEENDDCYNISGGEWAKLGIARNCQKSDPLLFIFDEPTAALDPMIESKIFESFDKITKNVTTVFISHRLGMVKLADRIIVMDRGMVKETGTHDSLMKKKGIYYKMFTEQLQLYDKGSLSLENSIS